jgi:hypothetical protein
MITNNDNFVYFIHCPSNSLNNGGAEILHQLAFYFKKNFEDNNNTIHIIPEVETNRSKLMERWPSG